MSGQAPSPELETPELEAPELATPELEGENAEAVEEAKTVRPGTPAGDVAQSDPSSVPPPNAE